MKIIQITDFHIPNIGEQTRGIDVAANMNRMFQQIQLLDVDALVITGDIAYKYPHSYCYEYLQPFLESLSFPVYGIAGNHDFPELLASVLPQFFAPSPYYFVRNSSEGTLFFLDSSKGYIDAEQLQWFGNELKMCTNDVCVFVHHPILQTDVVYMEKKHALSHREQILELLTLYYFDIHIFSGHFHVSKAYHRQNIHQYITPSMLYQLNPDSEVFAIDHKKIGYREIVFEKGAVHTNVVWLD